MSKARLDIWAGRAFQVSNDARGFDELNSWIGERASRSHGVVEATGRFHEALWAALDAAGIGLCVVNPGQARHFAGACGRLAETDAIDARVLADFGAARALAPQPAPSETMFRLRRLHFGGQALRGDLFRVENRRRAAKDPALEKSCRAVAIALKGQIAALDRALLALARKDANARRVLEIAQSVPGLGPMSAIAFAALLPELGKISAKEVAALAGLAPMNCDSGTRRGQAHAKGGRAMLRRTLFMAAVAAGQFNAYMRRFRDRLRADGKPGKVVVIAIARKLIVLANTLVREDRTWSPMAP